MAANGHVYATLGYLGAGDNSFSASRNTCKWMTLRLLSTDSNAGDPHSGGTSTLQVNQYSLDPRSVTFPDNVLTTWRVPLDGSIFQLVYTNTNRYSIAVRAHERDVRGLLQRDRVLAPGPEREFPRRAQVGC